MRAGTMGLVTAIAFALTSAGAHATDAPNEPLTEDECRAIWNTAAGRADLSVDGARPYIDSFELVDTNRDRKISNGEFKAACAAGHVHKFRGASE